MTNYTSSLYQPQAYQPNTEGKPRHCLLICGSPLQVLIAEQIIALNSRDTFDAILFTTTIRGRNAKYEYYFERLKSRAQHAYYVPRQEKVSKFGIYANLLRLLGIGLLSPRYDVIYLGPVLPDAGFPLLKQKSAEIYTLDEGSANLSPAAMSKVADWKLGQLYRGVNKLFPMTNLQQVRRSARKHITIYNLPHTSAYAHYIPLLSSDKIKEDGQQREKNATLMIGQPIYDLVEGEGYKNSLYSQAIVNHWGISYYLPHPREKYHLDNVEYIDTPMVAEDWILQYLKSNPDTKLTIYTYCSSTVMNLQGINGIEFVCIRPEDCPHYLLEVYDIASQSSSVRVLDVAFDADNRLRVLNSETK